MGKILVQNLARMMQISQQDLVYKLKSIGVVVEGDDAHIDTDIILAILQAKKLPHPREVILRDAQEQPAAPGAPAKSVTRQRRLREDFEDREHHPYNVRPTGEPSRRDIKPQLRSPSERPREVFISYAWGDETPEGTIRAEVVERLASALTEGGFLPVRDRDRIRPGDRISAFIRDLTNADHVVVVISDKYLRSPYCMYEIYRLWQKCHGDADDLAQHVVPIVLPEVKVSDFRERAPYLEYWADQAESIGRLIRNPKLSPSYQSWEEYRLVLEFAHSVDVILVFLKDILMPRKLEAHLDDDFHVLRKALQRRMGIGR